MLVADGAVAALHGGWRGLAAGIVAEGVAALRELGADGPRDRRDRPGRARLLLRGRRGGPRRVRRRPGRPRRASATSTSRRSRATGSPRPGVEDDPRHRALHDLRGRRAVLLPPPRRRRHRPPGGGRVAGLSADPRCARTPPACARRSTPPRAAPAATPADVELLAAVKYVDVEDIGALARRRPHAVRREPRAAARGQGRRVAGRRRSLALHRPAPEPQGQADPAARRADPLGRLGLGARAARAPRARRRPRSSSRSTSRGRRARPGSRPPSSRRSSTARPVRVAGLMGDAAVRGGPGGQPRRTSPRCASSPPSTACGTSRWAPRRTSRSPSRKGRRSCGVGSVLFE